MEIKRKFLIKDYPCDLTYRHYVCIEEGYISINPEIRIRKSSFLKTKTYHKIEKSNQLLQRGEDKIEMITKEEYDNYMKNICKMIKKKIYFLGRVDKDVVAELDVYKNIDNLVTVEVEFKSEKEAKEFIPPNWFGKEITYDERYKNKNLIKLVND